MLLKNTKKVVAIGLSLSMIANLSPQVYASDLVAIPQNNSSVIVPQNSSIFQPNSTDFSIKSIESKMSNILNTAKKGGEKKVNRKQLATFSGRCGTNVNWSLDTSTGKLAISGTGVMTDYSVSLTSYSPTTPWYSYRSYIKTVTIGSGVTKIGQEAFYWCSSLKSVTYLGKNDPGASSASVFSYCKKLSCLLVPSDYKSSTFCGEPVAKGHCPTPSQKNWFIDNVAWIASTVTILGAVVGMLVKYDKVKNFCLSHFCNKESETTPTGTIDGNLV